MSNYLKLTIAETGRDTLKSDSYLFNEIEKCFSDKNEIKEFLEDRYGKIPKGKNKIYIDSKNGQLVEIGFSHSFWNSDVSHNSKSWYQTDWITFSDVTEKPIKINFS